MIQAGEKAVVLRFEGNGAEFSRVRRGKAVGYE